MILIADGFERAKLKDIFYSLIQIKEYHHPAISYHINGGNIKFHAEENQQLDDEWVQGLLLDGCFAGNREELLAAISIVSWFNHHHSIKLYSFPHEVPLTILKENLRLDSLELSFTNEPCEIEQASLKLLNSLKMNQLIRYIDQESLQGRRLKIHKQSGLISVCGREGRLTLAEDQDKKLNKISHSTEHIDSNMCILQANIDDQNPEILTYVMERLFEDGANDVFFQPIVMKKGRNAVTVNILCSLDDIEIMEDILFKETTTFGVRRLPAAVHRLGRTFEKVESPWGPVSVKKGFYKETITQISPEFEECKAISINHHIPLKKVYDWVAQEVNRKRGQ
ncbi:LarC family nickel insertion protein [Cytobacillus firmus]|uniref:nickel insertion protein n=1 Tax=Cytobacillus firmus TaxID=1399 RepID=UPI0038517B88